MECIYCKKTYKTKSSLSTHQRTTKACLKLRENSQTGNKLQCVYCQKILSTKQRLDNHLSICNSKIKSSAELKFKCNHCKKSVASKQRLDSHIKICKSYADFNKKDQIKQEIELELQKELKLKDEKIKELEDKLKEQPKSVTNNKTKNINKTINNTNITIYEVMTPESVREFFKTHYNLETLLGGQKALAQFICDGFIREKQVYQCTDRSRQKFVIENKDGTQMEDANCDQLIGLTAPGLPHVKDVYEDALFSTLENVTEDDIQDNYLKISNIDKDRTEFNKELSKIAPSCSPKPVNTAYEDALIQLKAMRDAIIPRETKVKSEPDTIPVLQEIGGISLGQLDIYRQGYRKRFEKDGEDAEIKAPRALAERFATEPDLKHEYMEWIKS
jgi:hypothetical protein